MATTRNKLRSTGNTTGDTDDRKDLFEVDPALDVAAAGQFAESFNALSRRRATKNQSLKWRKLGMPKQSCAQSRDGGINKRNVAASNTGAESVVVRRVQDERPSVDAELTIKTDLMVNVRHSRAIDYLAVLVRQLREAHEDVVVLEIQAIVRIVMTASRGVTWVQ